MTRLETELARSTADRSSLDMEKAALEAKLVAREISATSRSRTSRGRSGQGRSHPVKELEEELDENRSELEHMVARRRARHR